MARLSAFWHLGRWIRKAALGDSPVDCRNRRGFSAEKRIHLPPPIPDVKTSGIFVYLKGFCCFSIIDWSAICISYKLYHNFSTTPFFCFFFYDVFVVLCSRFFVWGNHRQCPSLISPACNRSACRIFQLGDMEKWKRKKAT